MSYPRTPEHRRLRAELIQRWKPWEKSTGPKSQAGKAKVARNAYKGGVAYGASRVVTSVARAGEGTAPRWYLTMTFWSIDGKIRLIEAEEPPTLGALVTIAQNEIARQDGDESSIVPVGRFKSLLAHFFDFEAPKPPGSAQ